MSQGTWFFGPVLSAISCRAALDRSPGPPEPASCDAPWCQRGDAPDERRGAAQVATFLAAPPAELQAIRLVSHHMRLLGVLHRGPAADSLVLVDFDRRES